MKLSKKMNLIFPLVLVGCLLFSSPPQAPGFIVLDDFFGKGKHNLLIHKVHKPQWQIGYRYGTTCKPAERRNQEREAMMTKVFRLWLQPLEKVAKRPLVDSFRYQLHADHKLDDFSTLKGSDDDDLRIVFWCKPTRSGAALSEIHPPQVYMEKITDPERIHILIHEIGHAFGLHDTYRVDPARDKSTGGFKHHVGKQPSSIMSGDFLGFELRGGKLGMDDINGIVWLYKAAYEGVAANDCFFSDYVYEAETRGCRPKYPLIFEIKHSNRAKLMLAQDPNLGINARDASGRTALHYAVMYKQWIVVERLLARADLSPYLRDREGKTAADIAKQRGHAEIAEQILAHPRALSVSPKGKKIAVTWGELKHGD